MLSREETELWESVAKQAKPLRKRPRPAKTSQEIVDDRLLRQVRYCDRNFRQPRKNSELAASAAATCAAWAA
jgi:hypothetical protein